MINPLTVTTAGYLDYPLCVSTGGYVCVTAIVTLPGGGYTSRSSLLPSYERDKIPFEQLVREDEELIAIVIAAVTKGIIP